MSVALMLVHLVFVYIKLAIAASLPHFHMESMKSMLVDSLATAEEMPIIFLPGPCLASILV